PLVEPLSLDEAFLDVTASVALFGPPAGIARQVKDAIRAETALTASAGVAPSKFVAKIASDVSKPDGLLVVPADGVRAFLAPPPARRADGRRIRPVRRRPRAARASRDRKPPHPPRRPRRDEPGRRRAGAARALRRRPRLGSAPRCRGARGRRAHATLRRRGRARPPAVTCSSRAARGLYCAARASPRRRTRCGHPARRRRRVARGPA